MHQHDQGRIMALAAEELDPEQSAVALLEVEACEQCATDLELHKSSIAALDRAPKVGLTELESARLRREIRKALGVEQPHIGLEEPARLRVSWIAIGSAAAVLIGVLAAAPTLSLIGNSTDQVAFETIGIERQDSPQDALSGSTLSADSAETTQTEATGAATNSSADSLPSDTNLDELHESLASAGWNPEFTGSLRDSDAENAATSESATTIAEIGRDPEDKCVSNTLVQEHDVLHFFEVVRGRIAGRDLIVIAYVTEDLDGSFLVGHALDNCDELARAPSSP